MVDLIDRVSVEHPHATIQVSFIGYRDYGDAVPMIEFPFQNAQAIMHHIRNVSAEGGDDQAEDVAHALFRAVNQDWTHADVKIVFHIADAPSHGREFHNLRVSDRFPRGDPQGLDPRDFVEKLSLLDVHYTFVRIHESTDTMIEVFDNCYAQGGSFSVIDLLTQNRRARRQNAIGTMDPENVDLSERLTRSITASITQHYTTSQAS